MKAIHQATWMLALMLIGAAVSAVAVSPVWARCFWDANGLTCW